LNVLRKVIVTLLTSPEPAEPPPARRMETVAMIAAAAAVGGWIFAFHLRRFYGLGTFSDLYVYVQLATSWLGGRFLQDNYFGNYLTVHTYFLCPLLAIFVYPFGAPGLLFLLGLAAGSGVVAVVKILRLFGVPGRLALAAALLLTLMPLSLQVYQVDHYGFQIELLVPGLALWLAYFLLRKRWIGSLAVGLALQALKEDALLLIFPVTVAVLCEDLFRTFGAGGPGRWRRAWNGPAVTMCLLSLLVTPLLLAIIKSQPTQVYANLTGFQKTGMASVSGMDSLFSFLVHNVGNWLGSPTVAKWLVALLAGTFGLVVLRPHLLVLGLTTTLTAWLVHGDLLWAPRFAPALAFFQVIGCLAFASIFRLWRTQRGEAGSDARPIRIGAGVLLLVLLAGLYQQHRLAPLTGEIYRLVPSLDISPADRQKADALFAQYRREGRAEEPVIASEYLFRYVHDRNFYWYTRLRDRPQPAWILWDQQASPLSVLLLHLKTDAGRDLSDYELVGQAERFLLYRAWHGRKAAPAPEPMLVAGEPQGQIRLKIQPAPGRAGTSEPILSLGAAGRGELFFVHYLSERQLVLGMDSVGLSVQLSGPIDYEPGREYELELFCGSLLPPAAGSPAGAPTAIERLSYQNFVRIAWEGREVLNTLAPPHALHPGEVYAGYNFVRSGSAISAFSGKITEVRRGGYPPLAGGGVQVFGAVHLVVQLPESAAGVAEPLVVVGVTGNATLGYVRLLPEGKIQVGADFWSIGAYQSEPMPVDRAKPVEIIYSFPVFYPPVGDPRWGGVPAAMQEKLRAWLQISVNGAVVVDRKVVAPIPLQPMMAYGKNPAGGSVVTAEFTGKVLQVSHEPLAPR
jgi:hypothetical protein